jgi:hypothetical protein
VAAFEGFLKKVAKKWKKSGKKVDIYFWIGL